MQENYDIETPVRCETLLKKAPRPREFYWCRYPEDAELPEFWKERPVIVLSTHNSLSGCVFVVPCTTVEQELNQWAVPLIGTINGKKSWAICDKPSSFSVSRLRPQKGEPRAYDDDFTQILRLVSKLFPQPNLSENQRSEIVRIIRKRHPLMLNSAEQTAQIVDEVFGLLRTVKG